MSGQSATFDIILLFGPNIGNKPDYLPSSFLSSNVEIICPEDLYRENSEYGLRDIALQVLNSIKQNKQVLIDDELQSRSTRTSLLQTVMKKIPACRVQLVQVIPKYGFLQVMWSLQFSYAEGAALTSSKDEEHLRKWFDDSLQNIDYTSGFVDRPNEKEGYALETLLVPLQVKSHFKLDFPALLFQWEGVLNEKEELASQVEMLCDQWVAQNPCGHIIFICDGINVSKGILQAANESNILMKCLKQLALKIKHPVYAIQHSTASFSRSFCIPPQPGILAFLQLRHLLNLHSKNACYIFNDVNHMRMAETAGMRHVKLSTLKSPDTILKGQGLTSSIPAMLRTIMVKKPDTGINSIAPQIPTVPLFDCQHNIRDGHVSQKFANGLEEHVFMKDIPSFCHYQDEFAQHVTPLDYPGSKLISKCPSEKTEKVSANAAIPSEDCSDANIPHWMRKKRPRQGSKDEDLITNLQNSADKYSAKTCRFSKTIYVMTEKEVTDMAHQVLLQAGHEDIVNATDLKAKGHNTG